MDDFTWAVLVGQLEILRAGLASPNRKLLRATFSSTAPCGSLASLPPGRLCSASESRGLPNVLQNEIDYLFGHQLQAEEPLPPPRARSVVANTHQMKKHSPHIPVETTFRLHEGGKRQVGRVHLRPS